ncbi:MAG: radical SAM protein [Lachnospiraceae bacterium]|jgi:putative pyruvate formate lyase activating enzyme
MDVPADAVVNPDSRGEPGIIREALEGNCRLCPRECGADRRNGAAGFCGVPLDPVCARAALHFWEEPCISGKEGSGAVFFSGCSLRCAYCQNADIAAARRGVRITDERLAQIYLELQAQHANNINLVTAEQFLPSVVRSLRTARSRGLTIPVVYNSGGYERPEALECLRGLVTVFLPDCKYRTPEIAAEYSSAPDYPERSAEALNKMAELAGPLRFDSRGMIVSGMIVRHLVLPGHVKESQKVIRYLYENFGNSIAISIMRQYTPMEGIGQCFPELGRRVTKREYEKVVDYALDLGVENGFVQDAKTAAESFIPAFDNTGVLPE